MINQKPTILHAIDTTGPGGAETVFLDLAEQLSVEGFNNVAIIKGPGWVEEQLKKRQIPYHIIRPHGFLSLPYYQSLFRLLKRQRVRLIQAHLLGSTLTFSILSLLLRIPLVATLHGQVDINPSEKKVWLKHRLIKAGVDHLVAVSQQLADYIAQRRLFDQRHIQVIHNGVAAERYGKSNTDELRRTLGLPGHAILAGSVGNVRPAKAYHTLIRAAHKLHDEFPDLHFVIAGHQKPTLMNTLNRLRADLGAESYNHFIGFHENTAEFLGQMDLFVLSSSSEGFSIATIEAMATGLPVVATRCGGPEEIITHNKTGLLVDKESDSALADGIRQLLTHREQADRLAGAGRAQAIKTFSRETALNAYGRLYRQCLGLALEPRDNRSQHTATTKPGEP